MRNIVVADHLDHPILVAHQCIPKYLNRHVQDRIAMRMMMPLVRLHARERIIQSRFAPLQQVESLQPIHQPERQQIHHR